MVKRLILDTDIGTDTDDTLALALILASPELTLEGVTLVYGDVMLRARMANKLLRLRGRPDIPIRVGIRQPLLGTRRAYMEGDEGHGLLGPEDEYQPSDEPAVDFIIRTVMDNPGEIHLACIAPLSNIGMAFLREPRLAQNVASVRIMGGAVRGPGNFDLGYTEHNIRADAEASHVVFTSGAPITLVPLDVTTKVFYSMESARRIRAGGSAFHDAVATQIELYKWVRIAGASHAHDPLAVSTLIDPTFVKTISAHVDIELGGKFTDGATLVRLPSDDAPANAEVALEVDSKRFEEFLVSRIAAPF